jgi:hypothetical protein
MQVERDAAKHLNPAKGFSQPLHAEHGIFNHAFLLIATL